MVRVSSKLWAVALVFVNMGGGFREASLQQQFNSPLLLSP